MRMLTAVEMNAVVGGLAVHGHQGLLATDLLADGGASTNGVSSSHVNGICVELGSECPILADEWARGEWDYLNAPDPNVVASLLVQPATYQWDANWQPVTIGWITYQPIVDIVTDNQFKGWVNILKGTLIIPTASSTMTEAQVAKLYQIVGFSPTGQNELTVAATHPLGAITVNNAANAAIALFPGHNNVGDAQRHFMMSAQITQNTDRATSEMFLDAHEVTNLQNGGPVGETVMDLINNYNARILATAMPNISPADLAREAAAIGLLQTSPITIQ